MTERTEGIIFSIDPNLAGSWPRESINGGVGVSTASGVRIW